MKFAICGMGLSLILGGCELFGDQSADPMDDLRAKVEATVTDKNRSLAMLDNVDAIDALLRESAAVMNDAAAQERALFLDYDSSRDDYVELFDGTRMKRLDLQRRILSEHLEFKSHATPEEWAILSGAQANAVSSKINRLLATALKRE